MQGRAAELMPRVFMDGPWRLATGLRRLDPQAWLLFTEHEAAEIALKRRLLAAGADVVAQTPDAAPAIAEGLVLIEAFLGEHHPDRLPGPSEPDPLIRAGLLVQEDLCWLAPGADGYRLIAAFVAFPARWRLADKIGRPLAAIHEPVPGYADRLEAPVDRLFQSIVADWPVWRANWSILDDPALHQPVRAQPAGTATIDALWLRVERQTLRRLPDTGTVLFTIHSFVEPIARIAAEPEAAAALAARLEELSPAMAGYKALAPIRDELRAALMAGAAA